jgi:hypothetical protein
MRVPVCRRKAADEPTGRGATRAQGPQNEVDQGEPKHADGDEQSAPERDRLADLAPGFAAALNEHPGFNALDCCDAGSAGAYVAPNWRIVEGLRLLALRLRAGRITLRLLRPGRNGCDHRDRNSECSKALRDFAHDESPPVRRTLFGLMASYFVTRAPQPVSPV